ncbi:gustatory receptor for sugar taste 64f-like [Sitodiplosis mosellana]|uniref:gustatory receptor for sugar taste 64f-like n=1 Tax=Sitodiplosis mosellana TaxID=263140 RepID=UPI0024448404|nr:gustatory receptor for sugar taste 64f-like [Sitodiplosis mosellana]
MGLKKALPNKEYTSEVKWLQRATRKDFLFDGSFQEAIGPLLAMAQCFGIMPVIGIKSKTACKLQFKWNSYRTIYSFVVFILLLIIMGMTVWITASHEIKFSRMIAVIFYGSAVYGIFCFIQLAPKWPRIMRRWESVEAKMPQYRTQAGKRQLARRIKMISIIILMTSLVEHALNMISIVHYAQTCLDPDKPIKEFFRVQLSQMYTFLPYSPWLSFLGKFLNVIATFAWNYMDLFVMVVSVGLSSRFKQLNEDLERVKGKRMSEDFWALRRTQYRKLSDLCVLVDDAISQITLLSLSNNLFFITLQLLRAIRPMPSIQHAIYFWFSFIFLLSRTLAVSLYSSQIHDESKKPIVILRAVPTNTWNSEVRRFCEHVVNDTIALTGMRFFFLTRKLILSVAATIITYELVLIQFQTEDSTETECRRNW